MHARDKRKRKKEGKQKSERKTISQTSTVGTKLGKTSANVDKHKSRDHHSSSSLGTWKIFPTSNRTKLNLVNKAADQPQVEMMK